MGSHLPLQKPPQTTAIPKTLDRKDLWGSNKLTINLIPKQNSPQRRFLAIVYSNKYHKNTKYIKILAPNSVSLYIYCTVVPEKEKKK